MTNFLDLKDLQCNKCDVFCSTCTGENAKCGSCLSNKAQIYNNDECR